MRASASLRDELGCLRLQKAHLDESVSIARYEVLGSFNRE